MTVPHHLRLIIFFYLAQNVFFHMPVCVCLCVCLSVCLCVRLFLDYLKKSLTDFDEILQDDV